MSARHGIIIAALGLLTSSAAAAPCTLLTDAQVFAEGAFQTGYSVRIDADKITAVGAELPASDCVVVRLAGHVITPGLVETITQVGLSEVGAEKPSVDVDLQATFQDADHAIRASVESWRAFNPRSSVVGVTRVAGVTSVVGVPSGGVIRGRAFWADLTGGSQARSLQKTPAAMVATIGGADASRAAAYFHTLRVALEEAALWRQVRTDWERNRRRAFLTPHLDLIALQPVVAGALPLVVAVDRASDIEALLALTGESEVLAKVRLVVAGGAEAWLVRDMLAKRGVPVIVDPLLFHGANFDQIHARSDNAALLHEAGVSLVLSTFSSHNARKLPQVAGNAVRAGLTREVALRAITETPARVFGLKTHGRIAAGATANLVVWHGDPLEIGTPIERIYIHGQAIPLASRQTRLRDRYREVPVDRLR